MNSSAFFTSQPSPSKALSIGFVNGWLTNGSAAFTLSQNDFSAYALAASSSACFGGRTNTATTFWGYSRALSTSELFPAITAVSQPIASTVPKPNSLRIYHRSLSKQMMNDSRYRLSGITHMNGTTAM